MKRSYKLITVDYHKAEQYINQLYASGHEIISASTFFNSFNNEYNVTILYK